MKKNELLPREEEARNEKDAEVQPLKIERETIRNLSVRSGVRAGWQTRPTGTK
jgi:hypothetical protein